MAWGKVGLRKSFAGWAHASEAGSFFEINLIIIFSEKMKLEYVKRCEII